MLCYLTDEDLVDFLRRCKNNGDKIFIKENVSLDEPTEDDSDSSVARTKDAFEKIFLEAGLKIEAQEY